MKRVLIIILPCLLALWANAQTNPNLDYSWSRLHWAVHPSVTGRSTPNGATLDGLGNYIVVGNFKGSGNFGGTSGSIILSAPGNGESSGFIWKLDKDGKSPWAKQLSTARSSEAWDVEADKSGNIYVSGEFMGDFDADPGPGTLIFPRKVDEPGHFIMKLDPDGRLIWAKDLSGQLKPSRLAFDPGGRLVIGGSFSGQVDVDPGPSTHLLENPDTGPKENIFVMVWDVDGNFVWASPAMGNSECTLTGIGTDLDGNILATGSFGGDIDFDPGPGKFVVSGKLNNGFVWKLDGGGHLVWAVPLISESNQLEVRGTAIIANAAREPIIVGSYSGRPDLDPGPGVPSLTYFSGKNIFVLKLDRTGQFVWAGGFGGAKAAIPYDIKLDDEENIIFTGSVYGSGLDLDPGKRYWGLPAGGGTDSLGIFLDVLDQNGDYVFGMGLGSEAGGDDAGVTLDVQGVNLYLSGRFGNRMEMDPGPKELLFNASAQSSLSDVFVQKLYRCKSATYEEIDVISCGPYKINDSTYSSSGKYQQMLENSVGCDSILTIHLTVTPLPHPDLGPDRFFCTGVGQSLDPGAFASYVWQDGTHFASIEPSAAGTYSVTVTDTAGCMASDTVVIKGIAVPPSGFLPRDTVMCAYDRIVIRPKETFETYVWIDGSTAASMIAPAPGLYWLDATDGKGCTGRDTVTIGAKDCPPSGFHAPDAFTPNGDGLNDQFRPIIWGTVDSYSLRVFDRWGALVFQTRDRYAGWDGTNKGTRVPTGVFTWVCSYALNGAPLRTEKGTVVVIR